MLFSIWKRLFQESKLYLITLLTMTAVSLLSHNKVMNDMTPQHDQIADVSIKVWTHQTESRLK
jgi:hypothetical protein